MADTGAKAPTAAESVAESPWSTSNCGWVNPTYIYGAGEAAITHPAFDTDTYSYVLKAYTFDFSAIPDTATITGVSVTVNARYANGACGIALMQLLNTSRAKVGTNLASTPTALTTSAADYNFPSGGAPTLWGNALTPAWVKDADFGVAIGVRPTALNADVYVDSVVMTVYYQPQIVFTCTDTLALAEQAPTVTITTEGPATFSVSTGLSVAEQPPTVQVGTVLNKPTATALALADSIGELRIGQVGLSLAEALTLSEELSKVVPVIVPVFDSLSLADALPSVALGGVQAAPQADTFEIADSAMLALGGVGGSVEESVALVDAAALQLGEALLSASDSADFSDAPPDVAVGEAILELADALDASEDLTVTATGGGATKFDDIRGDIILGLNSAQSELTGWNAEVRDKLDVSAVVRTDDYTVTITLPPMAGYDITAPETITVTIPAVATDAGIEIVGEPTFDIGLSTLVTLSVQDTLSSEETMTSQVSDVTLTLADAIALAESLSNVKPGDLIVALADNFSVDDALSGLTLGALLVSLAEAAALSDSVDPRLGTLLLELAEAVAAADDATLLHGPVGLTLADDVALTEEQAAKISDLLASVVESLDAAEYLTAQVGDASIIYFNVYDILDIVESLTSPKIGNLLVSLTDSLTAAEEAAPQVGSLAILGADTVDASDSLTAPVIGGLLVNFAESVSLADVLPLLSVGQVRIDGAENLSLAEQVEARIGNLKIAADDALSIADVLTTQISGVLVTVNDSLAATTELTVWLSGASIIYFNVSDSLTLAETLAVLPSGLRVAIEDALAAGDAVALRSDIHLTLADALAIAEELNAPKISGLLVAMAETLTAAEIVTEALGQTTFTLADSLSATDVLSKTLSDLRLSLSDDVIVSEEAAAALTGLKVAVDETLALIEQFSTFGLDVGLQHADAVALIESLIVQVNLLASQVFEAEARLRAYQATPRARAFQARKRGRAYQATPRETEYVALTRKRNYTGEVH